jgi:hypothetical protein
MQIKTTMWHHLIPLRTAIIKKNRDMKFWWGYGQEECLYMVDGNENYEKMKKMMLHRKLK